MSNHGDEGAPDAYYSEYSIVWSLFWDKMVGIDNKGRQWPIVVESNRIYLIFENTLTATISLDEVLQSYREHIASKWLKGWNEPSTH